MKKSAALLASLFLLQPVFAQLVPMTPGQYLGSRAIGVLGDLAMAIGELATANQAIEDEVVTTRVAFFDSPDGAARAEAGRKFDEALMKRDLHYVGQRIINGARQDAPLLVLVTEVAGSHRVDGGLSPYSYQTFKAWADAVINSVTLKSPLQQALKDAMPQFEKYRHERDLVEMLFYNARSPLRQPNAKPVDYLAAWLLGTKDAKTVQAANASAAKIAGQVGAQRLVGIVAVLKSWSTIDNEITGPWGVSPRTALDPLIAGNPGEPYTFDSAAHRITFAEARSDFSRWHTNFVPQLNEVEQLWNQGRVSKDMVTLRLVVAKRDELAKLIEGAQKKGWDDTGRAQGDLLLSRINASLSFIDGALKMAELNAMKSGQMNPRAEEAAAVTREYLAKSSKLQLRSVTSQQQMAEERQRFQAENNARQGARRGAPRDARGAPAAAAPAATSAGSAVPQPPPVAPAAAVPEELGTPFDRAIAIAEHPEFQEGRTRMSLFQIAKQWEYWTTSDNRNFGWQQQLDQSVFGIEYELIQQKQFLEAIEKSVAQMAPAQREQYQKNLGKRDSLRREIVVELEALLPKMKQQAEAIKKKG